MAICRTGRAVLIVAVALILFQTQAGLAQDKSEEALPERKVIVWTNPILFVFTWYMAEVELALHHNHTVGISGSFLETTDGDSGDPDYEKTQYSAGFLFYRYYPTASFKGFFIGGQLGTGQISYEDNVDDESGNFFLAGVLIGYNWLLGDAQRLGVSIGIGANRYFGDELENDTATTLPVVRFINVGIAF
jgi:hypothetical protein